jgi:surface antigen
MKMVKPVFSSRKVWAVILVAALAVAGCANNPGGSSTLSSAENWASQNTKAIIGGLGGATAGGLIGAALHGGPLGIIGGALAGGLAGGAIGDFLDGKDKHQQQQAASRAMETAPSNSSVAWKNPDSGHSGTVTPVRTYQNDNGQYCREYQQTVNIGNQQHQAYGTACRQPDGSWKIVS